MTDYIQNDSAVYAGQQKMVERGDGWRREIFTISTPVGFVFASTYFETVGTGFERTEIEMIINGRNYSRSWLRLWGDKTITRLANKFARDLTDEVGRN